MITIANAQKNYRGSSLRIHTLPAVNYWEHVCIYRPQGSEWAGVKRLKSLAEGFEGTRCID